LAALATGSSALKDFDLVGARQETGREISNCPQRLVLRTTIDYYQFVNGHVSVDRLKTLKNALLAVFRENHDVDQSLNSPSATRRRQPLRHLQAIVGFEYQKVGYNVFEKAQREGIIAASAGRMQAGLWHFSRETSTYLHDSGSLKYRRPSLGRGVK
jgi:hypothetical protein